MLAKGHILMMIHTQSLPKLICRCTRRSFGTIENGIKYYGLLQGHSAKSIQDINSYTKDLKDVNTLFNPVDSKRNIFEQALITEAEGRSSQEYLRTVIENMNQNINKRKPYGRGKFLEMLEDLIVKQRGRFVMLLGPANSGKTLLMQSIKAKYPQEAIYLIDLKSHQGDLTSALLEQMTSSKGWSKLLSNLTGAVSTMIQAFNITLPLAKMPINIDVKQITSQMENQKVNALGSILIEMVNQIQRSDDNDERKKQGKDSSSSKKKTLTLILDDVDLIFEDLYYHPHSSKTAAGGGGGPMISEESAKTSKKLLNLLNDLTKKTIGVNVILTSNQLSFPYDLVRYLSFNTSSFSHLLLLEELAPREIYEVLTQRWQMKEGGGVGSLATALISFYGGDIQMISQALYRLQEAIVANNDFSPRSVWSATLEEDILACLEYDDEDKSKSDHSKVPHIDNGKEKNDHDDQAAVAISEKKTSSTSVITMRETLRLIAKQGFAPLQRLHDRKGELLSQRFLASVIKRPLQNVYGLENEVWQSYQGYSYGLIPMKQPIRLAIALVLEQQQHQQQTQQVQEVGKQDQDTEKSYYG